MQKKKLAKLIIASTLATSSFTAYGVVLEEIIVTAQKRSENIQDVPIAITAVTGDQLKFAGIDDTQSLQMVTPSLTLVKEAAASITFIRGVGNSSASIGQEASVAFNVDGVYNPSGNSSVMNFNNIERIEVLKGPQGTLFGRNATGGVINIITKDPSHDPSLKISAGIGNYETVTGNVYATTGLSDTVAADLAVYYKDRNEGYGDNLLTGGETGDESDISLRSKWVITPNDNAKITLTGFYTDEEGTVGLDRQPAKGAYGFGGVGFTGDYWDIIEQEQENKVKTWGAVAKINYAFDPFDFVSISSYRNDDIFFTIDQDSVPLQVIYAPIDGLQETVSQEFQFLSNSEDGPKWVLGLYFFDTDAKYDPLKLTGAGVQTVLPLDSVDIFSRQQTRSYAVFGEMTFDLTEKTDLTLGGRWTKDEVEQSGVTIGNMGPVSFPFAPAYKQDKSFDEPTWRLTLAHHWTDDVMGYLTYSRGYKSGTYNQVVFTGVPAPNVDPEILDAYELGLKGDYLDNRVRINASAFYYDYQDLQLVTQVVGGQSTRNAAQATVAGLEIDANIVATDNLSFIFGASYLDTEFDEFPNGPVEIPNPPAIGGNTAPPGGGDFKGNSLTRAPDYTFNATMNYTVPTEVGEFGLNLTYYYNNGFYWDTENRVEQPDYHLYNAALSWTSTDEKYRLILAGKNLGNEEYGIFGNAESFGDLIAPAPPRTYSLTFEMNFE